jgi:hypothetical protein
VTHNDNPPLEYDSPGCCAHERQYREEYDIVARVWRALGVFSYDGGPAIDERVLLLRLELEGMTRIAQSCGAQADEANEKLVAVKVAHRNALETLDAVEKHRDAISATCDAWATACVNQHVAIEQLTIELAEARRERDAQRAHAAEASLEERNLRKELAELVHRKPVTYSVSPGVWKL